MPEKRKKNQYNNVFLNAFREKNALLQQDVANYLGTTRGYISMVEKGDSKLSTQKLDMIFSGAEANKWDISGLVPAYSRLKSILAYIRRKIHDEAGRELTDEELKMVISDILPEVIEQKIKYGEIGITDSLANAISKKYPEINRQWIIDGTGPMLITPNKQPSELDMLREEVRLLREALSEFQAETQRAMASLPKQVAAEIERRSEQ